MIDQLRTIMAQQGITQAAVIDDVFDETPTPTDIDEGAWNIFLDDMADQEREIIKGLCGSDDVDEFVRTGPVDLPLVELLWANRANSAVISTLFETFIQRQAGGQAALGPLRELLFGTLGLGGGVFGSKEQNAIEKTAQLIFVDLFLGVTQDDDVMRKALERVRALIEPRKNSPPMVVLISSSQRLAAMRDQFRDDAGLLGCQFRAISKSELDNERENEELLYRLCSTYLQSHTLSAFVGSWQASLESASETFIKSLRRLDLRDYADLRNLILVAEGEPIGDYLLEIMGQYFQYHLEADAALAKAAASLNKMDWSAYPSPHFLPSAEAGRIADGLTFRNATTLDSSSDVQFGDLFFTTTAEALSPKSPPHDFGKGDRVALVPMTAACDLQRGKSSRILLLSGIAKPTSLLLHKRPDPKITPTVLIGENSYVITWDLGGPFAFSLEELKTLIEEKKLERVRRFRSIFALQLQQLFAGSLSRVGTSVMPPMQHALSARISYVDKDARLQELLNTRAEDRLAVVLVGRDDEAHLLDRLTLSPEAVRELRIASRKVDLTNLRAKDQDSWSAAIGSPEVFRKLEEGVAYERSSFKRPFAGTSYDILNVLGPQFDKTKSPISAEGTVKTDAGPIVIELSFLE